MANKTVKYKGVEYTVIKTHTMHGRKFLQLDGITELISEKLLDNE